MTFAEVSRTVALTSAAAGASALLIVGALTLASEKVQAKPAFAQATGKGCPTCHTAPPNLNSTGQKFKANGYKF
jgi:hypothetical protein